MSTRRFGIGVLIATGAVTVMAGIATARIESESTTTTIGAGSNRSVSAKCSRGSEAVSGGFAAPGFDPTFDGRSILPFGSKRASDRKWKTRGRNFSDNQSGKLRTFAYCDTHEPNLSVESKTKMVPPQETGSATAKCPGGREAVSGGWASPDGAGSQLSFGYESRRRGDRKWKVTAFNDDLADPQRLIAFVYCDGDEPNLKTKSDSVIVPSGEKRFAKAECTNGRKAYSGGFKGVVNPVAEGANGTFPFLSKRTGAGGWRGKAVGNRNGTHPFRVYAYCK